MYIALEGLDGTGKTTVAPLIAQKLEQRGMTCQIKPEFPQELFDASFRDALSKSLFLSESLPMHPTASFFYLLYADSLVTTNLDLTQTDVTIGDRCHYSQAIYQAYFAASRTATFEPENVRELIRGLYQVLAVPIPSHVFILDAPINECVRRVEQREERAITKRERATLEEFASVYTKFAEDAETTLVDASRQPSEVADEIAGKIALEYDRQLQQRE